MEIFSLIICGITAYLLGSIPTAVWYGTGFHGIDIREHGSKNAGATNTFRVLGKKAGTIVLLIDVLKGWVATSLALGLFYLHIITPNAMEDWKLAFGILAVIGHLFPIFSNFKGGKGVATLCGMLLSINYIAAFSCMGVFLSVFIIFHFVSLSSILAALTFPVLMIFQIFGKEKLLTTIFAVLIFLLVLYMHRKNIKRILNGQEGKMYLFGNKRQQPIKN
jgi:acyl phosphate:glycerol-3-phosphate acyltransferase